MDPSLVFSWHIPPLNETAQTDCCVLPGQYYWWLWDSGSVLRLNPTTRIHLSTVWNWHKLVIFLLEPTHLLRRQSRMLLPNFHVEAFFSFGGIALDVKYLFKFSEHFLDPLSGCTLWQYLYLALMYLLRQENNRTCTGRSTCLFSQEANWYEHNDS